MVVCPRGQSVVALGGMVRRSPVNCFRISLDGHGLEAAVDDDFGAGDDSACAIGGEEEGGPDEFFGRAEAGGWGVAKDFGDAALFFFSLLLIML